VSFLDILNQLIKSATNFLLPVFLSFSVIFIHVLALNKTVSSKR